jgi:Mrp family chromosome partitioning ATPase
LLQSLRSQADFVIIDSPPLLAATDAMILAVLLDGTLLVARAGTTRRGRCRAAAEILERAHARLIGTVLNAVPDDDRLYGYRYYQKRARAAGFLWFGRRPSSSPES